MEVLQRTANRGSISTDTGYNIGNSLKLERANSEYLSRTPSSSGNQQIFTFSSWVKFSHINSGLSEWSTLFSAGDYAANSPTFRIGHHTNNSLQVSFYTNSEYTGYYRTDALHRDTAAWYHFVCAVDTTQGTNTNRVKIYVNGVLAPTTSVVSHVAQNYNSGVNTGISHRIGHGVNMQTYASEYLADTHFVDGQALAPTEFGEVDSDSGIWIPKEVDVTYGTNGFYLDYADASDLGDDESGNGNDWTENNIAAADQATDTPTNNFCTISTPFEPLVGGPPTITEGATIMTAGSSGQQDSYGTMALFKGKWYFEFSVLNVGGLAIANMFGGVVKVNRLLQGSYNNAANGHHSHDGGWGGGVNAVGVHSGSGSGFSAVSGSAVDVVVGVAVDMDNGKIWWASGGTYASSSGTVSNPATATLPQFTNLLTQYPGEPVVPAFNHYVHQATTQGAFNFGNPFDHAFTDIGTNSDANGYGSFAYTPPSGYYAICSKNLAEYG